MVSDFSAPISKSVRNVGCGRRTRFAFLPHGEKKKAIPIGMTFSFLASCTDLDITFQGDINNHYRCNNHHFAEYIHCNYPQHSLFYQIFCCSLDRRTNCTYLLLNQQSNPLCKTIFPVHFRKDTYFHVCKSYNI